MGGGVRVCPVLPGGGGQGVGTSYPGPEWGWVGYDLSWFCPGGGVGYILPWFSSRGGRRFGYPDQVTLPLPHLSLVQGGVEGSGVVRGG